MFEINGIYYIDMEMAIVRAMSELIQKNRDEKKRRLRIRKGTKYVEILRNF